MISLFTGGLNQIAVVGAHCDDIAIGMGGTLLTLAESHPGLQVRALVLTGGGTEREAEEREALSAFCPGADVALTVRNIRDGRGPASWDVIKDQLNEFRKSCEPQVVFGPQRDDAHQDHRLLAKLLPTEFRNQLIFGYEILKWEADTMRPSIFHPLDAHWAEEKARLLLKHYPSQVAHDWFDEQAFLGLSRLRGVQCRSQHAEAFVVEKASITFERCTSADKTA
jgi:LmbE family N-acetylglucosaminyl deacetylase